MDIDGLKEIKIRVAFYHELGHFVAKEINRRFYNGSGTFEILIYPCERDPKEFCGKTNPIIPETEDKEQPVPLYKLAEHIASLSYGCFFQAYYSKVPLKFCQINYGDLDKNCIDSSLLIHSITFIDSEIDEIDNQYFKSLASQGALQTFISLNPINYLIDIGNYNFKVNIEKLKLDTENSVIEHYNIYKDLVSKYNEAIQKAISSNSIQPPNK